MNIFEIGISFINWLQSLGLWLAGPMNFISFLGVEEFYLLLAPAIFWCVDAGLGLQMGLFLMASNGLNASFKMLLHGPRPYWYDPSIRSLSANAESSFGVPSGHSQNAVVMWGTLANYLKRRWFWVVAILLILLIGISRLILAVHFLHDVLIGWLIGALLLALMLWLSKPISAWVQRLSMPQQYLVALGASLGLILLAWLSRLYASGFSISAEWAANALAAFPDEPIAPLSMSGVISQAGAFFGLAAGAIYLRPRGGFNTQGTWQQYAGRYIIGVIGVLALWRGLALIFPGGETLLAFIFRYLRYALVGAWITALAPLLFWRLKLAKAN
ncbi:MAG TPA: phosphatase PAP2 family protein [Anaerolineales bacterium]|nr:phosphatase PAP2 family protein [Anaerolineales bacterium]